MVHSDCLYTKPTSRLAPLPEGNFRCGKCTQCKHTSKSSTFSHPQTGKEYRIRGTISCTTTGIIYIIKCPCEKLYVGMTTRSLRTRMTEHRSAIKKINKDSPVALHFASMQHPPASFWYTAIKKVETSRRGGDLKEALLRREAYWIS